jgi:hypothetical protein
MKISFLLLAFLCLIVSSLRASSQDFYHEGRPVTANDLVGKTFCWENGVQEFYGPGGRWIRRMDGVENHGKWYVTEGGIMHHRYGDRETELRILPNGDLRLNVFCSGCTGQQLEARPEKCPGNP